MNAMSQSMEKTAISMSRPLDACLYIVGNHFIKEATVTSSFTTTSHSPFLRRTFLLDTYASSCAASKNDSTDDREDERTTSSNCLITSSKIPRMRCRITCVLLQGVNRPRSSGHLHRETPSTPLWDFIWRASSVRNEALTRLENFEKKSFFDIKHDIDHVKTGDSFLIYFIQSFLSKCWEILWKINSFESSQIIQSPFSDFWRCVFLTATQNPGGTFSIFGHEMNRP